MKVCGGDGEREWEVIEESEHFYIVRGECGLEEALEKDKCKPVTEPRWQDVTGECGTKQYNDVDYLEHDEACVAKIMRLNNYRLRKVEVWQTSGSGGMGNCKMAAFIIERKAMSAR